LALRWARLITCPQARKTAETVSRALNKLSDARFEIVSNSPEMDKVKKADFEIANQTQLF